MDPQYHPRPQIQQNLRTQVDAARFDQEEAHRQHSAARDQQLLDLTAEMRNLTRSIRRLTLAAVIIAGAALASSVAALVVAATRGG